MEQKSDYKCKTCDKPMDILASMLLIDFIEDCEAKGYEPENILEMVKGKLKYD